MRYSERNKQTLWYANVVSSEPVKDEWGNETGETKVNYSKPQMLKANYTTVQSDVEVQMFGVEAINTIVIIAKKGLMDKTSVIWTVNPNTKNGVPQIPFNYRIVGDRPSLSTCRYYATSAEVAM